MRPIVHEVEELEKQLLRMGGLVEESVRNSLRSLVENDPSLAHAALASEDTIDELEVAIDEFATLLLARQQPVARDLRFVTAALKINVELERMGDLAGNIARYALSFLERPISRGLLEIPTMAKTVEQMVRNSLDALVRRDEELARTVLLSDDRADDLKDSVYAEALGIVETRTEPALQCFDLIFIAHNLERIADHATNIAEDVIFWVRGADVRHNVATAPAESRQAVPDRR
jgi:phosphate transport system protein